MTLAAAGAAAAAGGGATLMVLGISITAVTESLSLLVRKPAVMAETSNQWPFGSLGTADMRNATAVVSC